MTKDDHITPDLITALLRGESGTAGRLFRHLVTICPDCSEGLRQHLAAPAVSATGGDLPEVESYPPGEVRAWFVILRDHLREERPEAERDFEELLTLPEVMRPERVRQAQSRFRSLTLARLLIERARERTPEASAEAVRLAELAEMVAEQCLPPPHGLGLVVETIARARAWKGNALRVAGRLRQAEAFLTAALQTLETSTDLLLQAETLTLLASLRRDQRRLGEAREVLQAVTEIYRAVGDDHRAARTLVQLAAVESLRGHPLAAYEIVTEALEDLDPGKEPRVYLCAAHDRAAYLAEAERYRQARRVLRENAALYEGGDRSLVLQLAWLEARIAAGLGEPGAEAALAAVRDRFAAEGWGPQAAMVALDLAALYVTQGRAREVRPLAQEIFALLEAEGVHREALAALALFRQAAEAEALTLGMVRRLALELRHGGGVEEATA